MSERSQRYAEVLAAITSLLEGEDDFIAAMATVVCEEKNTLEDVYEPFLIQSGFLVRTPRGRMATVAAYEHFGRPLHPGLTRQPGLFE